MLPVKKILEKLNGLHYRQEYLCFAKASHSNPLYVYLVNNSFIIKDITNEHLFVGYNPLIFAFTFDSLITESIQLIFSQHTLSENDVFNEKDALAYLDLKIIKKQVCDESNIFYYEGTTGKHYFLSSFHQYINKLNNRLYNKKPGNVFLHDNLYTQVQIAYAIPRNISLITVKNEESFNLFPTDLHGQIDADHYIISLRSTGKACEQVEAAGRVLISEVNANMYKTVYGLGKNHMQPLKPKTSFPFLELLSENLHWPLPEQAISYTELVLADSFVHGIHKIFLFKIIFQEQIHEKTTSLCHIHNSYATWRYKNGLPGNYLLR